MYRWLVTGFISLLWISTINYGFIYQIQIVGKNNQYIIGLSDWHDRIALNNHKQRAQLLSVLRSIPACKVIIEDSCDTYNHVHQNSGYYNEQAHGTLAQFTHQCRNAGIDISNVEYRFCRIRGIGPLLYRPTNATMSRHITIRDLLAEIYCTMSQVAHYNDTVVQQWYQDAFKKVNNAIARLQLRKYHTYNVESYCRRKAQMSYNFLKTLLTFDSTLLDCKLLHEIVSNQKPYVIVLAGGTHIDRTFHILKRIGYKLLYQSHIGSLSNLSERIFCYPVPIDLTILNRFFDRSIKSLGQVSTP